MRSTIFTTVTVLVLGCFLWTKAPAQVQGKIDAEELKKFHGTWVMVSAEMDGKKVKDEHVKKSRITFVDENIRMFAPHQHKDTITATLTKLDLTKDPGEMSWIRSNGPKAGTVMTAIYKFEGPDLLQVCFDSSVSVVPKAFATKTGSGHIWQTWKRVK